MIGLARKSGYAFTTSPGDCEAGAVRKTHRCRTARYSCASWKLAAPPANSRPLLSRADKTKPGSGGNRNRAVFPEDVSGMTSFDAGD